MLEDLKETAPCGIRIHYTVDECDMVIYNDINGRGEENMTKKCEHCSWRCICKPSPYNNSKIFK